MRVVVAHTPGSNPRMLRQVLLGAGLDCSAADCVTWDNLAVRLAQGDADLVVVTMDQANGEDWSHIREASSLTLAPIMAIGPSENNEVTETARAAGALEFVDESQLPQSLDAALDRLNTAGAVNQRRGMVVSVFSPTPGTGTTTIAANLAGALTRKFPNDVGFVELTRSFGKSSLLFDLEPQHTVEDACQRWRTLDSTGLGSCFAAHKSGVSVLGYGRDMDVNSHFCLESTRRVGVLSRVVFGATVMALDSHMGQEEIESMRLSDHVVFLVQADVPSVRRAQRVLQSALEEGVPADSVHLVINRWGQSGQLPLKRIEETLGLDSFMLIPDDPSRVNKAANQGRLLQEVSGISTITRRISKLATRLVKLTAVQAA